MSETQKHMGRKSLLKRLAAQTGSKEMAVALLKKRGHMDGNGRLTAEGKRRDEMTAAERAKDRAARDSGRKPSDYTYNKRKNTARLKRD